ncbi:MAG: peptide MFS transporter [Gammaproteobacteria bacterium]
MSAAPQALARIPAFRSQPRGLALLFVVEMWERYSYYGMRALLVLFLVADVGQGGMGWDSEAASRLYGWYTGLVYLTPILGGYLADRYLGTHRALLWGGVLIALGHFSLAFETEAGFYAGLVLLIAGTGLFKPNVSTMVGQLYTPLDARRDAGFTLFYVGINLGALIGPLVCGYLAQSPRYGWGYGFGAAGIGMLFGLAVYGLFKRRYLGEIGAQPMQRAASTQGGALTRNERDRVLAILILAFFVTFFWLAFEQAGSSMTLFAERSTDRSRPGWLSAWLPEGPIPSAWFQSVNPAFILMLAPFFSLLWMRLAVRGREPGTPVKMALGLVLLASGFAVLVLGAYLSDQGSKVSPGWLVGTYFLHTCGELCLSPVGLSCVTRIAPLRFAAMLMGTWFLSSFAANLLAGYLAGMMDRVARGEVFQVLGGQADFFLILVLSSCAAGLVLLAMSGYVRRLIEGRAEAV